MREYDVTITETLRKTVTVEAESMEEAEQIVSDQWNNSEYILDADDFIDVSFETENPYIELSYEDMTKVFLHANNNGHKPVSGYIVFDQSSFHKPYSEESRTYCVSSDNKAYKSEMGGYSVFGSCLDGSDPCIRLDEYMRGPQAWKIERCYMDRRVYHEVLSQPVRDNKGDYSR